jgi:3-methyladenine DNA glycosylase/8-oxoguanine DNA glycosylase
MASAPIRDQLGDRLITPQNAALLLIDYQPSQFAAVRSMDPRWRPYRSLAVSYLFASESEKGT